MANCLSSRTSMNSGGRLAKSRRRGRGRSNPRSQERFFVVWLTASGRDPREPTHEFKAGMDDEQVKLTVWVSLVSGHLPVFRIPYATGTRDTHSDRLECRLHETDRQDVFEQ